MVGPRFLYGYMTEGGVATVQASGSTASGYDPQNAVALDRVTSWKAGDTTAGQRLAIHCSSAITPTGLGICGGNWSQWGTVLLRYSDDGSSWSTLGSALGSLPSTDSTQDYYSTVSGASAHAWWGLEWSGPSAAPEVACFYLGTLTTLTESYHFPDEASDVYGVNLEQSEGRVIVSEEVARQRARFKLDFNVTASSTVRNEVRTILASEGGPLRPFYFVPIDESGSSTAGQAYLVRYEPLAFGWRRLHVNPYEFSVPLLEEV